MSTEIYLKLSSAHTHAAAHQKPEAAKLAAAAAASASASSGSSSPYPTSPKPKAAASVPPPFRLPLKALQWLMQNALTRWSLRPFCKVHRSPRQWAHDQYEKVSDWFKEIREVHHQHPHMHATATSEKVLTRSEHSIKAAVDAESAHLHSTPGEEDAYHSFCDIVYTADHSPGEFLRLLNSAGHKFRHRWHSLMARIHVRLTAIRDRLSSRRGAPPPADGAGIGKQAEKHSSKVTM